MWNVEQRFDPKALEGLAALGFSVGSTRGVVRVEKYGCGAEFRQGTDSRYQLTILPTIMVKGQFARLWDAGYQKFLLTDEGLKLPALASHLQNLRSFNEELRTAPARGTSGISGRPDWHRPRHSAHLLCICHLETRNRCRAS